MMPPRCRAFLITRLLPAMLLRRALPLIIAAGTAGLACSTKAAEPAQPTPEIMAKLTEAQDLQRRQRYVDALATLDEIEAVMPKLPDIYNMRGSIYLAPSLRDFDKAEEMFNKADALRPGELAPQFNKSELAFVKHDWAAAQAGFQKVLDDFPKLPLQIRHLVLFKRLVCEAKLGQIDAARKTLKDHFTFMDDTPAYYYGHAAIAFQTKDEKVANEWIGRAESIFNAVERSAYVDTLMEARWVPSITLLPVPAPENP